MFTRCAGSSRRTELTLTESRLLATDGMAGGGDAVLQLSGRARRCTAVVALTDRIALGILRGAREAGIDVPDELSVVGFDDLPESAFATPALTTVRVPHFDLGIAGMQVAIWLLGGGARTGRNNLPVELTIRETTAAPSRTSAPAGSRRCAVKQRSTARSLISLAGLRPAPVVSRNRFLP